MRIGITANPNKRAAVALARRALDRIGDRGEVVLSEETAVALERPAAGVPLDRLEADVLVAIGGDGTFLFALHHSAVPLLAVHAGTVGFLAEIEGDRTADFDAALDRVLSEEYFVDDRMKLAGQIDGRNLPDATNEVVVHTSQVSKMRQFEISVDGLALGRIRADGIILSTPTGSTSYSLSALGPIVEPGVEAILVTAIAPFQVTQRAVIIDPLHTVSVRVVAPPKDATVVVDGRSEHPLAPGGRLVVYRSPRKASFVRFQPGFFQRLRGRGILPWRDAPGPSGGEDDAGVPS